MILSHNKPSPTDPTVITKREDKRKEEKTKKKQKMREGGVHRSSRQPETIGLPNVTTTTLTLWQRLPLTRTLDETDASGDLGMTVLPCTRELQHVRSVTTSIREKKLES